MYIFVDTRPGCSYPCDFTTRSKKPIPCARMCRPPSLATGCRP